MRLTVPADRRWVLPARFVAHNPARTLQVVDMVGMSNTLANPGKLVFERDGQSYALEAVANADGSLGVIQQAFQDCHGLQCGFCTPGMVMSAIDLVKRHNYKVDETTVRHGLEGNLCRCTGYHNIVKAVLAGAKAMQEKGV